MEDVAQAHRDPLVGPCALGMPPTIGPYLTPRLLPAVKRYLPDLRLDLIEGFTASLEERMAAGRLDLAILATTPARPGLSETPLYEEPFWVALPNGHALAEEEDVDLADIASRELLLLSDGHCLRDQVYAACNLDGIRSDDAAGPRTQNTSLSILLALVGAGEGVTLVPATSLAEAWTTDGGISVRRERRVAVGRSVRLIHRDGYPRPALVARLADIVAGILPDTVHPQRR